MQTITSSNVILDVRVCPWVIIGTFLLSILPFQISNSTHFEPFKKEFTYAYTLESPVN